MRPRGPPTEALGDATLSGKLPCHFARVSARGTRRKLDADTLESATDLVADAEAIDHVFAMAAGVGDEDGMRWRRHWRAGSTLGESPLQHCNVGSQGRDFGDRGMQPNAEVAGQYDKHSYQHGRHNSLPFRLSNQRSRISTATGTATG